MIPEIRIFPEKQLVGIRIRTSLSDDKTVELWRTFMPRRKEIKAISSDLFSIQVYDSIFDAKSFNPGLVFEKWAATEVLDFEAVPEGMETFILKGGLYAVFVHKGASTTGAATFAYIFETWLPASGYEIDHRAHFEILGEKYRNNHPDSEEEICIPIREK